VSEAFLVGSIYFNDTEIQAAAIELSSDAGVMSINSGSCSNSGSYAGSNLNCTNGGSCTGDNFGQCR
jgi:hypothetical protein